MCESVPHRLCQPNRYKRGGDVQSMWSQLCSLSWLSNLHSMHIIKLRNSEWHLHTLQLLKLRKLLIKYQCMPSMCHKLLPFQFRMYNLLPKWLFRGYCNRSMCQLYGKLWDMFQQYDLFSVYCKLYILSEYWNLWESRFCLIWFGWEYVRFYFQCYSDYGLNLCGYQCRTDCFWCPDQYIRGDASMPDDEHDGWFSR